ncbi:MAG TPA: trypsin-like serine protease [Kofleriaceae bacterium]|nr:trypsin-like serine protease [Kofleriaceae bacterium]
MFVFVARSSPLRGGLLLALASAVLGGCTDQPPPVAGDPPALDGDPQVLAGDPRAEALQARGALRVELAEGASDPTVVADARDLVSSTLAQVGGLDLDGGHALTVRYLGKGRLGGRPEARESREPAPAGELAAPALTGIDAFNPATRNEFRIELRGGALEAIGRSASARGLDSGSVAASEPVISFSWSNGDDDRYRPYGINAPVTNSAHRMLVKLGGCSGTLVGPRHIVTAGHCLYDRDTSTWSDDFWVRAGRNGTSNAAQVFVDNDNIPGGQVLWYYTPPQYRAKSGSTWGYDYGILVVPARLGDTTGWMGRVAYTAATLNGASIYRRGYPACNHPTRTDEPSPCEPNHLYANAALCDVGEYQSQDGNGWHRVVHHSCDASAGDSGSSLYVYHNGTPAVTGIHFASRCETSPGDNACTGSLEDRPLAAIRLTPEYRDWIGYFRDLYP